MCGLAKAQVRSIAEGSRAVKEIGRDPGNYIFELLLLSCLSGAMAHRYGFMSKPQAVKIPGCSLCMGQVLRSIDPGYFFFMFFLCQKSVHFLVDQFSHYQDTNPNSQVTLNAVPAIQCHE